MDADDVFPEDYREWADADGDGEGDNADTDDDNDGWSDTDEMRQGTDHSLVRVFLWTDLKSLSLARK